MPTKVCTRCGTENDLGEFPPNKEMRDGRGSHCRACHMEYGRRQYYEQHDLTLERASEYRENNRAACNKRSGDWAKRNKSRRCVYEQNRRALKQSAPGNGVTMEQWATLLNQYGNRCIACGSDASLTIDHVVPLSCGGAHDITNIQPLCLSCNSAKKDKTIDYRTRHDAIYNQDGL